MSKNVTNAFHLANVVQIGERPTMDIRLDAKAALVTGGGAGIGRAIAEIDAAKVESLRGDSKIGVASRVIQAGVCAI